VRYISYSRYIGSALAVIFIAAIVSTMGAPYSLTIAASSIFATAATVLALSEFTFHKKKAGKPVMKATWLPSAFICGWFAVMNTGGALSAVASGNAPASGGFHPLAGVGTLIAVAAALAGSSYLLSTPGVPGEEAPATVPPPPVPRQHNSKAPPGGAAL
jgi:hypothetical protein